MSDPRDTGDQFSIPEPPPYEAPVGRSDPAAGAGGLAEWWQRVVALIIDNILIAIASGIVAAAVGVDRSGPFAIDPGYQLVALVLGLLYFGFLNGGERGQTLGKMATSIQVRDADTGGPIGVGRGMGREFIVWLLGLAFGLPLLINYLWPLWDPRRQGWHDKAVRSVVVRTK